MYKDYELKVTPFHIYDKVPTVGELPPFIPLDKDVHDAMYDHTKFLKDLYLWADKDFEVLSGLLCQVDSKILHGYLESA